jgi:ferredoxin
MQKYSKILIYYFSGTGNAYNIVKWLAARFSEKSQVISIINIAETDENHVVKLSDNTLIVFISPVHGFNYPPIMIRFINHFPKGNNDIVVMNTRAGMLINKYITPGLSGISLYYSSLILKLKGYKIVGMNAFDMPSNWLSLHPSLNTKTVLYIHLKMKAKAEKFADILLRNKTSYPVFYEIIQDLLIMPISIGYYFIGRFILSKTFYANSSCDNCDLCITKCPVKAIVKVENRPFWKLKCESCMKCMSNCPKRAIETAHGFIFIIAFGFNLLINKTITSIFPSTKAFMNSFVYEWILQAILFILFLLLTYRISHYLLKFKWYERFMVYTSLTFYKFWGKRYKALKNI